MDLKELSLSKVQEMYLDRVNNFLTDERFSEYYGIELCQAKLIIAKGAEIQEIFASLHKELRSTKN